MSIHWKPTSCEFSTEINVDLFFFKINYLIYKIVMFV